MAAGPLRAGGVLREVRLQATSNGRGATQFALVLAGTPDESDEAFDAATPLISGPGLARVGNVPGWYEGVETAFRGQRVFPLSVRIDSGSRWVVLGWYRTATYAIFTVLSVTVIGFARMGANGHGVEDGIDR